MDSGGLGCRSWSSRGGEGDEDDVSTINVGETGVKQFSMSSMYRNNNYWSCLFSFATQTVELARGTSIIRISEMASGTRTVQAG